MDYPSGWYFASFGEDLKRGRARPVTFFGKQYALFRTESGAVGMIDSQCCHMGADLGRCGVVRGERLVCGYHAWEFGTSGRCEVMPRTDRIPERARQETPPAVIEHGGDVFFWRGPEAPRPFPDLSYFTSPGYITLRGELHTAASGPLPVIEHIADIYHFPHNHKIHIPVEYKVLRDEGPVFEYQLRPTGREKPRVQGMFEPYAFIEFAGPCTGIYRTQRSAEIDRTTPLLTMLLSVTPIDGESTLLSWRIAARKVLPDFPFRPVNRAFARMLWLLIRWNYHNDLEVLKWMRPPENPLWVGPDGMSVRHFQAFYQRNIPPSAPREEPRLRALG